MCMFDGDDEEENVTDTSTDTIVERVTDAYEDVKPEIDQAIATAKEELLKVKATLEKDEHKIEEPKPKPDDNEPEDVVVVDYEDDGDPYGDIYGEGNRY